MTRNMICNLRIRIELWTGLQLSSIRKADAWHNLTGKTVQYKLWKQIKLTTGRYSSPLIKMRKYKFHNVAKDLFWKKDKYQFKTEEQIYRLRSNALKISHLLIATLVKCALQTSWKRRSPVHDIPFILHKCISSRPYCMNERKTLSTGYHGGKGREEGREGGRLGGEGITLFCDATTAAATAAVHPITLCTRLQNWNTHTHTHTRYNSTYNLFRYFYIFY